MQPRRRRSARPAAAAAAEVVDLSMDGDGDSDDAAAAPAPTAAAGKPVARSRPPARTPAAAAAASPAEPDCEFVDSSDDDDDADADFAVSPAAAAAAAVPKAATGRKRVLGSASKAAAAAADAGGKKKGSGSQRQPPAKRAKTTAGAAKGSRSKQPAFSSKQATAKGFGALFLSASQVPAAAAAAAAAGGGGSQQHGHGEAGGSQQTQDASQAAAAAAADPADADEADAQLWVDKHAPASLAELVVHKKKVEEVTQWLTWYGSQRAAHHTRALLITGPPGCGKSATLRAAAASLGYEVVEWSPPVPTTWADHQYLAGAGLRYSSKLDEFDEFVARCKFAALPLACTSAAGAGAAGSPGRLGSQQQQQMQTQTQTQQQQTQQIQQTQQTQPAKRSQKLILVEDLPFVSDADRRARLAVALRDLATTARAPVVVVATSEEGSSGGGGGGGGSRGGGYGSYGGGGAGVTVKGLHKDFLSVLDAVGAGTIAFNPVTANNIVKALSAVAAKEGAALDPDTAAGIATAAGGDLRNALQNLQMLIGRQGGQAARAGGSSKGSGSRKGKASKAAPKWPRKGSKQQDPAAAAAAAAVQAKVAGEVGRDQHLSVFHAIGKLLHYKREGGEAQQQQQQQQEAGSSQQQQQQEGAGGRGGGAAAAAAAAAAAGGGGSQQPQLHSRYARPPLRLNPEDVIQGSGLEAMQVTSFLAENFPLFMVDDAAEEAAAAAAYLSDAALLACHRNTSGPSVDFWDEGDNNAASIAAAAASSVAARGVLFANTRPAPSRWLPLRGPSCYLPDRATSTNMLRLAQALQALQDEWAGGGTVAVRSSSSSTAAVASAGGPGAVAAVSQSSVMRLASQLLHAGRQERAAQVLPFLQALSRQPSHLWLHSLLPRSWAYIWNGSITERAAPGMQGQHAGAARAALAAAAERGRRALAVTGSQQQAQQQTQQQTQGSDGGSAGEDEDAGAEQQQGVPAQEADEIEDSD